MLVGMGATSIIFGPRSRLGVYIDNETPDRNKVAVAIRAKIPREQIVVGLYPSEAGLRISGCITALQWYPFPDEYVWDELPGGHQAYIVQWDYCWPGARPATAHERSKLLMRAAGFRPAVLWVY